MDVRRRETGDSNSGLEGHDVDDWWVGAIPVISYVSIDPTFLSQVMFVPHNNLNVRN